MLQQILIPWVYYIHSNVGRFTFFKPKMYYEKELALELFLSSSCE